MLMKEHAEQHVKGLSYICKICGFKMTRSYQNRGNAHRNYCVKFVNQSNRQNEVPTNNPVQNKKPLQCSINGKQVQFDKLVKEIDELLVFYEESYCCVRCNMKNSNKVFMRNHAESHITNLMFECTRCGYQANTGGAAGEHIKKCLKS